METRTLGRTNLSVSVLGLGAAEIGFEDIPPETVDRLVGTALDNGLNVIDTAECYRTSEEHLGRALAGRRNECFLFTKCGHATGLTGAIPRALNRFSRKLTGHNPFGFHDWERLTLDKSIERSLRLLRTDYIDVLQLHICPEEILRRGEVIESLQRARQAGKTRYIGYSGEGGAALYAVECGAFDTLQISLNFLDQEAIDKVIPEAKKRNVGVIAKRPVANAVWRYRTLPDNSYHHIYWQRLAKMGYDGGCNGDALFSTALRFTLTVSGVHTAIVGTSKPARCEQNADVVAAGPLDAGQFQSIRQRWKAVADPAWVGQE